MDPPAPAFSSEGCSAMGIDSERQQIEREGKLIGGG
jgi:hypothetical protein